MTIRTYAIVVLWLASHVAFSRPIHLEAIKNQSSVTYRLVHPLHVIEATSKEASFRLETDSLKKVITGVSAQVDVMTFDSGNSNRDSHAMEVVDALTYPDVTFSSTSVVQSGDSLNVTGILTFHGVTKEIKVAAGSSWPADTLRVQGDFRISLTDFNIDRPSLLMIPVQDTLQFFLTAVFSLK